MTSSNIRKFENFHILLWLIKDLFWVMEAKLPGLIMIFPTLGFAILITIKNRLHKSELVHNLAVCLWISANSIWMTGEFFYEDSLRQPAIFFFIAGFIIMGRYYLLVLFRKQNIFRKNKK